MMGYLNFAVLGLMIVILLFLIRIMIYRIANMPLQERVATQDFIESVVLMVGIIVMFEVMNVTLQAGANQQLAEFERSLKELLGGSTLGVKTAGDTYIDFIITYLKIYRELLISIKDKATNDYDRIINRFARLQFSIAGISLDLFERLGEQIQGKEAISTELAKLGFIIKTSFNLIVNLSIVIVALEYLKYMAALIIITGIVLRAIYLTKGLGSALIAFTFSFYIIFPTILSMLLGTNVSNVNIGIEGSKLRVDGVSYYSASLVSFNLDEYAKATNSVKEFLNFLYNRLNIAIWLSLGFSLGIAFYLYGLLTGGSLIWGAPVQLLRLL
ncbi:MAG: hypothetical protein QW785_01095 [Candidatus Anstonellales archaeon]